jgi:GNAT superfamily N-acetyltransferase
MSDALTWYRYTEDNPHDGNLIYTPPMRAVWPDFMMEDDIANHLWDEMYERCQDTLFYLCEGQTIVAQGKAIPLYRSDDLASLPDDGWDWALQTGLQQKRDAVQPNMMCALEIAISAAYRGRGISRRAIAYMRQMSVSMGFDTLIAPVRPSRKAAYPLIPMQEYITWQRDDGLLFDPWLRTHQRNGAEIIRVCETSMRISGSIDDWEDWTEMQFPGSGWHIIDGALNPVYIDCDIKTGLYIEPNVWMVHYLS